jgi:hypothetical protein
MIALNELKKGRFFPNGKDLVYEIENFWITDGNLEGKNYSPVLVSIHKYVNGKFEKMESKEVELKDLKPLPNRPEFVRLHHYNSSN